MKKILLTSVAMMSVLACFNAKAADSATGTATVEVVKAFDIQHVNNKALDFGKVFAKAGTISIAAATGAVTDPNGIELTGFAPARDEFEITGPAGQTATVSLDAASVTLTGSGTATGETLTATGLALSETSVTPADPDVAVKVYVGGSLTVLASTKPGPYTGHYGVTISY